MAKGPRNGMLLRKPPDSPTTKESSIRKSSFKVTSCLVTMLIMKLQLVTLWDSQHR